MKRNLLLGCWLHNFYIHGTWERPRRACVCHDVRMKRILHRVIAPCLPFLVALAAAAENVPGPVSPERRADPFEKEPGQSQPARKAAVPPPGEGLALLVFETFSIPLSLSLQVLEPPDGPAARYQRMADLVQSGKARLVNLVGASIKAGSRNAVESIDEYRYPTEFEPPQHTNESAFGTAFETRDVGDRIEHELITKPDDSAPYLNYELNCVTFLGIRPTPAPADFTPIDQPTFASQRTSGMFRVSPGIPRLMSTLSPSSQKNGSEATDADVWMTFLRFQAVASAGSDTKGLGKGAVVGYTFISMDRNAAQRMLSSADGSDAIWHATQRLPMENNVRIEHVMVLPLAADTSVKSEESIENRYGTEFEPPTEGNPPVDSGSETTRTEDRPGEGSKGPEKVTTTEKSFHYVPGGKPERSLGSATAFETRNAGYTIEQQLTWNPTHTAGDLAITINRVGYLGNVQHPGTKVSDYVQPLFEHRIQRAVIPVVPGTHFLVGTLNPPGEDGVNGRKDDGRVWLCFAQLSMEQP